jgi:hypothetical protein
MTIGFEVETYCVAYVDVLALLPSDEDDGSGGSPVKQECTYKYW